MNNLSQGNLSVSAYFTKCKQLWDEYIVLVTPCICESVGSAMKLMERQQLMQFLMGLNEAYQVVKSNILMLNPLPTVSQACSIVIQEEQQREIKVPHQPELGSSAFLSQQRMHSTQNMRYPHSAAPHNISYGSQQTLSHSQQFQNGSNTRRATVQCNYCRNAGHTIDKCFKL